MCPFRRVCSIVQLIVPDAENHPILVDIIPDQTDRFGELRCFASCVHLINSVVTSIKNILPLKSILGQLVGSLQCN